MSLVNDFLKMYEGFNPNNVRMDLVMRTASGVELFYNAATNTYMSEDMDAIIAALEEDMKSNNPMDVQMASGLLEKLQHANISKEC